MINNKAGNWFTRLIHGRPNEKWELVKIIEDKSELRNEYRGYISGKVFYYLYESSYGSRKVELENTTKPWAHGDSYYRQILPWVKGEDYKDIPSYMEKTISKANGDD